MVGSSQTPTRGSDAALTRPQSHCLGGPPMNIDPAAVTLTAGRILLIHQSCHNRKGRVEQDAFLGGYDFYSHWQNFKTRIV